MEEISLFSISSNKVQPAGAYDTTTKCGEIMISFKSFKFEFVCSLCYKANKYKTFYDLYEHVTKDHNLYSEEIDRPVNVLAESKTEKIDDPLAEDLIQTKEVFSGQIEDDKLDFDEYIEEDEEEIENGEEEGDFENEVLEEYRIEPEDGLTITRMDVCELPAVNSYTADGRRFIPFGRYRPKNDSHCNSAECKERNPKKRKHILHLIDMYRKCIGLWHTKTARNTPPSVKTTARKLMVLNSEIKVPVPIMRLRLCRMTDCFNSSWKRNGATYKPWFYEEMKFLQFADFDEIPDEAFDDFQCPFCKDREVIAPGTLALWKHIVESHKLVGNLMMEDTSELAMTWPTEHILEFIDIYREQESLWNSKCKDYYNRPLKAEAYKIMLEKFNTIRPNTLKTRNDVKDIIKQLRIYFRRADKKYKVSNVLDRIENTGNDIEYTIYEKFLFLKDIISPRPPMSADFECDICKKSFTKKFLLHEHFKLKHKNLEFKCDRCPMAFESEISLNSHQNTQHQGDGKIYNCPICHSEYSNLEDFDMHLYDHLPERSLAQQICPLCDITMNDRGNLLIHLRRHCDIKKFHCEVCSERFITSSELRLHKTKHSNERPYVCEICGVGYKYKHHLVKHNRYHREPTLNCDECGMKLYTRKELIEHKKAHTYPDVPLGKFICELCGALFSETSYLARHKVKVHKIKIRSITDRNNLNKLK